MNYCRTDYSHQIKVRCLARNLGEVEFWQGFESRRRDTFGRGKQNITQVEYMTDSQGYKGYSVFCFRSGGIASLLCKVGLCSEWFLSWDPGQCGIWKVVPLTRPIACGEPQPWEVADFLWAKRPRGWWSQKAPLP